jgi:hypothetical protein
MKTIIGIFCFISTVAFTQEMHRVTISPMGIIQGSQALAENYLLMLTVTNKDRQITEPSLAFATAELKATPW